MGTLQTKFRVTSWKGLAAASLAAFVLVSSQGALASQIASKFYHGTWNCKLDGRSSKMIWKVVDDTRTICDNGTCSVSHGVKEVGFFRDSSGPWVSLAPLGISTQSITFRHADGNKWYLARSATNRMSGHSTWQGNNYPLSCWR